MLNLNFNIKLVAKTKHNIIVVVVIGVILVALIHIFTVGYGVGFESRGKAMIALQQAQMAQKYAPSHLTIHYSRQMHDEEDILRLEIDTTYRAIGKGVFSYEMICDRKLALQSVSGERFTEDEAKLCFIEGTERKWTNTNRHKSISGYNCWAAAISDNGQQWQAWYTTELPHCSDGAKVTDGLKGLIMMLRSSDGDYTLLATAINENRG